MKKPSRSNKHITKTHMLSHPHTLTHWHCLDSLTQPSLCSLQQLPNVASKTQPFAAKPVMERGCFFFYLSPSLSLMDLHSINATCQAAAPSSNQTITQFLRECGRKGIRDREREAKEEIKKRGNQPLWPAATLSALQHNRGCDLSVNFLGWTGVSPLANEP